MKKLIARSLIIIYCVTCMGWNIYGENSTKFQYEINGDKYEYNSPFVTITIDGMEVITGAMPAINHENRTLVPVREVFESAGIRAKVSWNESSQRVTIISGDKLIVLEMGSKTAYINNKKVELDVAAQLIKAVDRNTMKAMIPLRFVSEELGFKVEWIAKEYKAILKSPKYIQTQSEGQFGSNVTNTAIVTTSVAINTTNGSANVTSNGIAVSQSSVTATSSGVSVTSSGLNGMYLPTSLSKNPIIWGNDLLTSNDELATEKGNAIVAEAHPMTTITNVTYANNTFVIQATAPITYVKTSQWNGKFIIDIENAEYTLNKYEYTFDANPYITSVRTSQYTLTPKNVRVVMDLKAVGEKFIVTLSEDRREILINGIDNKIIQLKTAQNDQGDYVDVIGNFTPEIKVMRLTQPDRLVFDLPNTLSMLGTQSATRVNGQFINAVRTSQFDNETTRVVLETNGHADYEIQSYKGYVRVQLMPPSYKNIDYTNDTQTQIKLETTINQPISIKDVKYTDNYLKKEYIIELPSDYSKTFGTGTLKVNDGKINSIDVVNVDGKTKLIIHEAAIYEFRVQEVDGNITVVAYEPRDIYKQIIVIDPGHGGKDPGAIGNGLYEKNVNLSIALYLKSYLDQNPNIKVYYTRLDDTYPTLTERVALSNAVKADRFISIHNNAYRADFNGTETLYFDGGLTSGLDGKEFATIIQKSVLENAPQNDRLIRVRNDLFVLRNTEAPAVLLEMGYITHEGDSNRMKSEEFKKNQAKGIYLGILQCFKEYPTTR